MKAGRIILVGLAVVVVVVVALFAYVWSSLDSIVQTAIEKYGSQATQTEVSVSSVSLALTKGEGSISGLTVANPSGFTAPHIFSLGGVSVRVDPAQISEQRVVISEIVVSAPKVAYEINDQGTSNVDVMKRNLGGTSGGSQGGGQSDGQGGDDAAPGPKLIIDRLLLEQAQMEARVAALKGEPLSATLPPIELKGIGREEGGVTAEQVAEIVVAALIERVGPAVAKLGIDQYVGKKLGEVSAKVEEKLGKEAAGKVEEKLGTGAGDAIKGLLNR